MRKDKLKIGKIFISAVILIQWNFISYMIPAREWWAFAFFFIVLAVFFFDMKMMVIVAGGIVASIIISWVISGDSLVMLPGDYFMPDLILRIICIFLTTATLFALTHLGGKFLVEELEKFVNYDTLTHLLNRRSMDNYLQAAKRHAETGKATFCLMLMDIDDFKKVNDTYDYCAVKAPELNSKSPTVPPFSPSQSTVERQLNLSHCHLLWEVNFSRIFISPLSMM